jgi:two-component system, OmpR family, flagellar system response regulator FtcR
MYIIIDDRNIVAGGYATGFDREGVSSAGIESSEFREWIGKISDMDMSAVEAFLIGDCSEREALSRFASGRTRRFFASTSATRSTIHCVCSPPAPTMSCASRSMCGKSWLGPGRSTGGCSAKTAT